MLNLLSVTLTHLLIIYTSNSLAFANGPDSICPFLSAPHREDGGSSQEQKASLKNLPIYIAVDNAVDSANVISLLNVATGQDFEKNIIISNEGSVFLEGKLGGSSFEALRTIKGVTRIYISAFLAFDSKHIQVSGLSGVSKLTPLGDEPSFSKLIDEELRRKRELPILDVYYDLGAVLVLIVPADLLKMSLVKPSTEQPFAISSDHVDVELIRPVKKKR